MKIIITILAAAFPAAVSAQAVSPTLGMVEQVSVSAASNQSLSGARVEAGKPFSQHVPPPAVYQQPGSAHHDNGVHNGQHHPQPQPTHLQHPVHPQPPVVYPPQPYYPPYNPYHPGWDNDPYHPTHPYTPGYYPPYPTGPSHETTQPVIHHPVSGSTWAIVGAVALAVLLLVVLL